MVQFYNSLTRKVEEFVPLDPNKKIVTMYNCGPTVYNYCHIGNFRSFLLADLIRRTLEMNGYEVDQVMNITDVGHMTDDDSLSESGEDKMATALKGDTKTKAGKFDDVVPKFKDPYELANFYTQAFFEDMEALNFRKPQSFPKATDHINEMVDIIKVLLEKNIAYEADDGTIYFDINKFPQYGKLSNNSLENLRVGGSNRIDDDTIQGKRSPYDFSLWKKDDKHLMKWDTELGTGFPGWHIECSAMSMKQFGDQMDIHTGGEDNKFPHHECEIAQSEAYSDKQFVKYWLHGKHLRVDNDKMSKSKGNFYTIKDLLKMGYHPLAVRWSLMNAHFTKSLNFTLKGLEEAQQNIEKLVRIKEMLEQWSAGGDEDNNSAFSALCKTSKEKFKACLDDNLNLPEALSHVFIFANRVSALKSLSQDNAKEGLAVLRFFDQILGVIFDYVPLKKELQMSEEDINALVQKRVEAKANKDWAAADQIRNDLKAKGIIIEDSKDGSTWKAE